MKKRDWNTLAWGKLCGVVWLARLVGGGRVTKKLSYHTTNMLVSIKDRLWKVIDRVDPYMDYCYHHHHHTLW